VFAAKAELSEIYSQWPCLLRKEEFSATHIYIYAQWPCFRRNAEFSGTYVCTVAVFATKRGIFCNICTVAMFATKSGIFCDTCTVAVFLSKRGILEKMGAALAQHLSEKIMNNLEDPGFAPQHPLIKTGKFHEAVHTYVNIHVSCMYVRNKTKGESESIKFGYFYLFFDLDLSNSRHFSSNFFSKTITEQFFIQTRHFYPQSVFTYIHTYQK
jgi:hypothetical protein